MKPNDLENHTAKSTTSSYNHTTMKWNHTKVVATYDRSPRTNWTEKSIFEITKGAYQKKGVAHQYVVQYVPIIFQFHIYVYIYIYLEPGVNRYTNNILAFGNWKRFQKINREERKIRVHKTNPGNLSWPLIEIRFLAWWYNDVFSTPADCSFEGLWRSEGVYTIHAVTFLQSESQR